MTTARKIIVKTYKLCDFMYEYILGFTDGETVIGLDCIDGAGRDIDDALLDDVEREMLEVERELELVTRECASSSLMDFDAGRAHMVCAMVSATIDNTRRHLHTPLGMGCWHEQ